MSACIGNRTAVRGMSACTENRTALKEVYLHVYNWKHGGHRDVCLESSHSSNKATKRIKEAYLALSTCRRNGAVLRCRLHSLETECLKGGV